MVSLNAQPTAATKVTEHGTEIAAIAGAPMNGVGTVGIYPELTLASYTLAGFDDASIIAALDAVTARGPSVVNLSLGGPGFSQSLYESILRAVNAGSIVVASAGNSTTGQAPDFYPADYPHVLTVGSTARNDSPSSFSIRSPTVDLAAPGEELGVLDPAHPTNAIQIRGTSFSTPIVSAAAAWLWTARPGLDDTQVTELLRRTAQDVGGKGFDVATGFGIPRIPSALAAPAPGPDPQEPNDDIALVVAGGLLVDAKPALFGSVKARVDDSEDPRDVYRLVVPAGKTARILLRPHANLGLTLWSSGTTSVTATGADGRRHRLGISNRKGKADERLTWRNASRGDVVAFVESWIPAKKGTQRGSYTLSVTID